MLLLLLAAEGHVFAQSSGVPSMDKTVVPTNAPSLAVGIPIPIDLPRAGLTTVVIDDAQGNRVRNLVSELYLPKGRSVIIWDGYDDGVRKQEGEGDLWNHDLTRHRVAPGTYTIRGLVHDRFSLRYEFSVNSPGTPPWKTADGSGGWLADHTPPADILYLPKGTPSPNNKGTVHFLVCSSAGETGEAFVWLNATGKRLFGTNTGFWGGTHLTRDPGPQSDPNVVAYTFISGERDPDNDSIEVRAIHANGQLSTAAKITFPLEWKKNGKLPVFTSLAEAYGADGLAAYNGIVVFTITRQNRVIFADARTQKILGEERVSSPRSMVFDAQGRLFVVSGANVLRYDKPDLASAHLGKATLLITTGLEAPRRIALDEAGNIYVTDWGERHQVRVFTAEGRLLRIIGKPGGPTLGHYDEHRMSFPAGLTVDGSGQLWVTEAEVAPKRLSIWDSKSGGFHRAIYGPSQYGGGGKIDGGDPTRLYMDPDWSAAGVTWALDWKTGASKPVGVYWRRDNPKSDAMPTTVPETVLRQGGFRYMTDAYNGDLRYNQDRGVGLWRLDTDGVARPVALFGNGADLVNQIWGIPLRNRDAIVQKWQNLDPTTVFYVWCDRNGDGIAQPDEVQFVVVPSPKDGKPLHDVGVGVQVNRDLSLTTTWGVHVAPPILDRMGLPHYDLSKIEFVGDPSQYSERVAAGGWAVNLRIGNEGLTGSKRDGTGLWSYQSTEGGQPIPGLLTEPTRLIGLPLIPRVGDTGPFIAENSDKGGIYLITMDGLFLQTLGGDSRNTPLWRVPFANRGMDVSRFSFSEEQFHPTVTQLERDGRIYFVVGHEHSSIARLDGLETVKRLNFGSVTVRANSLAALPETRVEPGMKTERNVLAVPFGEKTHVVDGKLDDWADAPWARIDDRASAAVALSHDMLYAVWKTGDPGAIESGTGDIRYQFKRGGALDLMIGTNPNADPHRQEPVLGDLRLLVTRSGGVLHAILYRAVASEASPSETVLYDSPIGKAHFDQVLDVTENVKFAASGTGDYELSIPLSVLGLGQLKAGQHLLADIGLLRGNAGQTTQRVYWNNRDTSLVSDVPSEARLRPGNWGVWEVQP
jgi:sugar lactone lactonase YvrE